LHFPPLFHAKNLDPGTVLNITCYGSSVTTDIFQQHSRPFKLDHGIRNRKGDRRDKDCSSRTNMCRRDRIPDRAESAVEHFLSGLSGRIIHITGDAVLSCLVQCCPVLPCHILSLTEYHVISCRVLSCHVMPSPCPILSHPIFLSYPTLSYPILSYPILSCPVLSCPVLSCAVLSCLSRRVLPCKMFLHSREKIKVPGSVLLS
jgi:hypothetical protein